MATLVVVADPSGRPEPLKVRQRRRDGDIVCFEVAAIAGQRPQHAQRLGCRERGVEPGDRLHHPTIGDLAILQRVAELCPRDWVAARQQSFQRRSFDGAGQAEAGCLAVPSTLPAPRPGRQSDSGCSTPPTLSPTRRGSWSPAASVPTPDRPLGHLSAEPDRANALRRSWTLALSPSGEAGTARRKQRDDRRSGRQKQPPRFQPSENNAFDSAAVPIAIVTAEAPAAGRYTRRSTPLQSDNLSTRLELTPTYLHP